MSSVKAMAVLSKGSALVPFEFLYEKPLASDEVEVAVSYCGICHSDLSMIQNDWGMTQFPLVPGHEAIGTIVACGSEVKNRKIGQTVGIGWYSKSCQSCPQCLSGDQNLCLTSEGVLVNRHGGFATRVRCQALWATPLPERLDPASAGPLFCGGITVFNPIVQAGVLPTDRVGVVGVGGLGHLAIQFLKAWGCEVTAFSNSNNKTAEILKMGAHHVVSSTKEQEILKLKGTLDFILVTVNVSLPWNAYFEALKPRGRLHVVGAVLEPIPTNAFTLIGGQKSISGTPLGSPATILSMLEFCERHHIAPTIETFPLSKAQEAMKHLVDGKARYRIVLKNDL